MTAHIIFVGACIAAFFSPESSNYSRIILSSINLMMVLLGLSWTLTIGARHKLVVKRLDEIGDKLNIPGYYPKSNGKRPLISLPFFGGLWYLSNVILWVILFLTI
jgi:hypothetical protein